eukprot:scaffold926_cov248-Pinguiococcus_pyrenoidosus.AAC.3
MRLPLLLACHAESLRAHAAGLASGQTCAGPSLDLVADDGELGRLMLHVVAQVRQRRPLQAARRPLHRGVVDEHRHRVGALHLPGRRPHGHLESDAGDRLTAAGPDATSSLLLTPPPPVQPGRAALAVVGRPAETPPVLVEQRQARLHAHHAVQVQHEGAGVLLRVQQAVHQAEQDGLGLAAAQLVRAAVRRRHEAQHVSVVLHRHRLVCAVHGAQALQHLPRLVQHLEVGVAAIQRLQTPLADAHGGVAVTAREVGVAAAVSPSRDLRQNLHEPPVAVGRRDGDGVVAVGVSGLQVGAHQLQLAVEHRLRQAALALQLLRKPCLDVRQRLDGLLRHEPAVLAVVELQRHVAQQQQRREACLVAVVHGGQATILQHGRVHDETTQAVGEAHVLGGRQLVHELGGLLHVLAAGQVEGVLALHVGERGGRAGLQQRGGAEEGAVLARDHERRVALVTALRVDEQRTGAIAVAVQHLADHAAVVVARLAHERRVAQLVADARAQATTQQQSRGSLTELAHMQRRLSFVVMRLQQLSKGRVLGGVAAATCGVVAQVLQHLQVLSLGHGEVQHCIPTGVAQQRFGAKLLQQEAQRRQVGHLGRHVLCAKAIGVSILQNSRQLGRRHSLAHSA